MLVPAIFRKEETWRSVPEFHRAGAMLQHGGVARRHRELAGTFEVRRESDRPALGTLKLLCQSIQHRVDSSAPPLILLVHGHHRFLKFGELASQLLLRASELAKLDEHAYHVDTHCDGVGRAQ